MKTEILDVLIKSAIGSIDEKGIFPQPAMIVDMEDKNIMIAMACGPVEMYENMLAAVRKNPAKEIMMTLDRTNLPNQGIDMKYHSVLTISHWMDGKWNIGALPYASKKEVGEVQWDNEWWITNVSNELKTFGFMDPVETDLADKGTAYKEKINLILHRKTEMGTMYEGLINKEKLSDKVQQFLDKRALNINDRDSIVKEIRSMGHKFEIIPEGHGFWTAKAGKGIFPARSSKTKVYLEAVESIIEENEH